MTLLKRINDAGVHGESLGEWSGDATLPVMDGPLHISLALSAPLMEGFITDLDDILGDYLRMTVQTIIEGPLPMHVVKVYAPTKESRPRLIFFPGWATATERKGHDFGAEQQAAILAKFTDDKVQAVSLDLYVSRFWR
jgi:hypothetical protein